MQVSRKKNEKNRGSTLRMQPLDKLFSSTRGRDHETKRKSQLALPMACCAPSICAGILG